MKPRGIKDQIIALDAQGYNYNQIKEMLSCSKGTISYHLGKGQKEKVNRRKRLARKKKRNDNQ